MCKKITKSQVHKKYVNRYIEFNSTYDYSKQEWLYEVNKTSDTIRENMTLGQDVGTALEYCR